MSKAKSWNREIDFQCRFGVWPFQKTLDISAKGFTWCGTLIPLREITRLRWGVELKRGGAFPKRLFIAVFGTDSGEYVIKTKQKDFYEHLVERYWKAAGRRLLSDMLDGLENGAVYSFGPLDVGDRGAAVNERTLLGADRRFYEWEALRWDTANGFLNFMSAEKSDRQLAGLSFIQDDNTHILSAALRLFEKSAGQKRLSRVNRDF